MVCVCVRVCGRRLQLRSLILSTKAITSLSDHFTKRADRYILHVALQKFGARPALTPRSDQIHMPARKTGATRNHGAARNPGAARSVKKTRGPYFTPLRPPHSLSARHARHTPPQVKTHARITGGALQTPRGLKEREERDGRPCYHD